MPPTRVTDTPRKPRVFFDADVLFAGAASGHENGASLVLLRMAEITLIEGVTSQQVIVECERNLGGKVPAAMPAFQMLVTRCLRTVPALAASELSAFAGMADAKDLPILAAAVQAGCGWLVTFNVRHFQPGHPSLTVLRPGDFILRVRELLAYLP
jgi:predicted nucleic acid-binding protein